MSPLSKDETRRDSSLTLMISHYAVIKTIFMYFCVWFSWPWRWLQMWPKQVLLAVKMVADVTETRIGIQNLYDHFGTVGGENICPLHFFHKIQW